MLGVEIWVNWVIVVIALGAFLVVKSNVLQVTTIESPKDRPYTVDISVKSADCAWNSLENCNPNWSSKLLSIWQSLGAAIARKVYLPTRSNCHSTLDTWSSTIDLSDF